VRRSDQRKEAVFALYQRDVTERELSDVLESAKPFTRELAEGADAQLDTIDAEISSLSKGWTIDRIAPLDLAVLRIALYELHHSDAVPAEVAIDEAFGIAAEFCGADAPGFVNGILGAAARQAGVAT
jgi:transcription antitermination protein NusB